MASITTEVDRDPGSSGRFGNTGRFDDIWIRRTAGLPKSGHMIDVDRELSHGFELSHGLELSHGFA
jgi:hypothetical protein